MGKSLKRDLDVMKNHFAEASIRSGGEPHCTRITEIWAVLDSGIAKQVGVHERKGLRRMKDDFGRCCGRWNCA
jgi:hypothetical protein